jgi:hypothetical protein
MKQLKHRSVNPTLSALTEVELSIHAWLILGNNRKKKKLLPPFFKS